MGIRRTRVHVRHEKPETLPVRWQITIRNLASLQAVGKSFEPYGASHSSQPAFEKRTIHRSGVFVLDKRIGKARCSVAKGDTETRVA